MCEFTHEFDLLNYDYDIETKLSEAFQMNVDYFYLEFESTLALTSRPSCTRSGDICGEVKLKLFLAEWKLPSCYIIFLPLLLPPELLGILCLLTDMTYRAHIGPCPLKNVPSVAYDNTRPECGCFKEHHCLFSFKHNSFSLD